MAWQPLPRLISIPGVLLSEWLPSLHQATAGDCFALEENMHITGVVIAKGAPNLCSDGRRVMCSIVVSEQFGLVRLYPLRVGDDICLWSKIQAEVERPKNDSRYESFHVTSAESFGVVKSNEEKESILDSCCLQSGDTDPVIYQNKLRASIFIVKPDGRIGGGLEPRDNDEVIPSSEHDDAWVMPQCSYPYKPYISWVSYQGVAHRSHLLSQEVYMGMLNNASTPYRVFDNLRIGDPDYCHWLIMGNINNKRNVWVIAHLHRQKKTCFNTRLSFATNDGNKGNWPYLQQEAINAKRAEPQRTFSFTT